MNKKFVRPTEEEEMALRIAAVERMAAAGAVVSVDPDVADAMGVFVEDAVPLEDALASRFDDQHVDDDYHDEYLRDEPLKKEEEK